MILSVKDSSFNSLDLFSASALTIFFSASILSFSSSCLAVNTFCSATCFSSIALLNSLLKLKLVILKSLIDNPYLDTFLSNSSRHFLLTSLRLVINSSAVYFEVTALIPSSIAGSNTTALSPPSQPHNYIRVPSNQTASTH